MYINLLKSNIVQVISNIPIIIYTNYSNIYNIIFSFFILLNSGLRINYPSSYCPLSQIKKGYIYHPYFARVLANIAELIFYYEQAKIYKMEYWYNLPFYLTLLGEILCWIYLISQKDIWGLYEDCVWLVLQIYFYCGTNNVLKYYISLPFIVYMILFHLPYTCINIISLKIKHRYRGTIAIGNPTNYNLSWIIPSLIAKQFVYGIFLK